MYDKPPKPTPSELQGFESGDLYLTAIEPIWDLLDLTANPRKLEERIESLPKEPAHLFAAHVTNSEICNGGLHQFFRNPSGAIAPESVKGFRLIGANEAAGILANSLTLFLNGFPRGWARRREQLESLEGDGDDRANWDPFFDMDQAYFQDMDSETFAQLADEFVHSHPSSFFVE